MAETEPQRRPDEVRQQPFAPALSWGEQREAERRSSLGAGIVHESVRMEGEEELRRPVSALAWSGLAAGLSMGFSLVAEGLLRAHLPDTGWRPLIATLGYTLGYLIVILGRQQLFTENTLTVILPLLSRRDGQTLVAVLRLWGVVLAANLVGAGVFAWFAGHDIFSPGVHAAFAGIAREAWGGSFLTTLMKGIVAGWLIALLVWLLPAADTSRVSVILILTYVIGLGSFAHVIAGSIEVLYGVMTGAASWGAFLGGYLAPTLLGNIVGGVALVAALNHAQVIAGDRQ